MKTSTNEPIQLHPIQLPNTPFEFMGSGEVTPTLARQITRQPPVKSIFASRTFWGVMLTTVTAIAPIVGKDVDAWLNKGKVETIGQDVAQILVILMGAGVTIYGRVQAGSVYTPKYLPGPSKSDFQA